MEPPRQKWTARAILLAGALAGFAWIASLNFERKVSTDVLDLVPSDERSPELSMVRSLAGEDEARILLLALRLPARIGETPEERAARGARAAGLLSDALSASPAVAEAMPLSDNRPRDALASTLFAKRFDLLLPGWLEMQRRRYAAEASSSGFSTWLSERTAADLESYLAKPEALATQDILPSDPLLLARCLPPWPGRLPRCSRPNRKPNSLGPGSVDSPPQAAHGSSAS
jgi:hypothetical protein